MEQKIFFLLQMKQIFSPRIGLSHCKKIFFRLVWMLLIMLRGGICLRHNRCAALKETSIDDPLPKA
jgi:hypothetical protein